MKSLLADPEQRTTLDVAAVDQYLSLLYVPAPASIFSSRPPWSRSASTCPRRR